METRRSCPVTGIGAYLPALESYKATDNYTPTESWLQSRDRKQREKQQMAESRAKGILPDCMCQSLATWRVLS